VRDNLKSAAMIRSEVIQTDRFPAVVQFFPESFRRE